MKKIITATAFTTLLLSTLQGNVQNNFEFGDVFKDLKDTKAYEAKASQINFEFGDVFKDLKDTQAYEAKASQINFEFGDVFKDLKNPS